MSEKYIDLRQAIFSDLRDRGRPIAVSIGDVLNWLDAHRDQVPGRTITQGQLTAFIEDTRAAGSVIALSNIGITVIQDPEPTVRERFVQALVDLTGASEYDSDLMAEDLLAEFEIAQKAPGGES